MKHHQYDNLAFLSLLKIICAILLSTFVHCYWIDMSKYNGFETFQYICCFSVELFFIISGMLFYLSLHKKAVYSKESIFKILKKKYIRIFPLMFISTTFILIGKIVSKEMTGAMFLNYFAEITLGSLTFWNGKGNVFNHPMWFIGVLFLVYVIGAIITKIVKKYGKNYVVLFAVPIILGICIYVSNNHPLFWNINNARGLIAFFIGVILMMFLDNIKNKSVYIISKIVSSVVLAIYIPIFFVWFNMNDVDSSVCCSIQVFFLFTPLIIILYGLSLNKFITKKIYITLSKLSTFIYFFHYSVLGIFQLSNCSVLGLWGFPLNIACNIVFALIFIFIFKYVDKIIKHNKNIEAENRLSNNSKS